MFVKMFSLNYIALLIKDSVNIRKGSFPQYLQKI